MTSIRSRSISDAEGVSGLVRRLLLRGDRDRRAGAGRDHGDCGGEYFHARRPVIHWPRSNRIVQRHGFENIQKLALVFVDALDVHIEQRRGIEPDLELLADHVGQRQLVEVAAGGKAGLEGVIAGEGPERAPLEALIARLGLGDRVRLLGARAHEDLPELYTAADALVLASTREGWANVLLEAMACGTPVVASDAWGNPEVVQERAAGVIAPSNTPEGLAAGVRDLLDDPPSRAATRAYAERFGWAETTAGQMALFREVLGR